MSESLVMHATVTVRGDAADLGACREDFARVLRGGGGMEEHHGPQALAFDLKVKGGLPFPAIVDASRAHPRVTIAVEWVNLEAGQRGAATISGGRLAEREIAPLAGQSRAPVCVRIAPDGRILLACTVVRFGPGECRGYVISADRDAVFRATRWDAGGAELAATEGAAEWAVRWRMSAGGDVSREAVEPPEAIPAEEYADLERMALDFAADWVWFSADPEQDVAIERERLMRRGHAERSANLRSAALARIEELGRKEGGVTVHDAVPEDLRWVEALLARCWAEPCD